MIQIRNVKQQEYSSSQQEIKFNNTMLIFNLIRDHMPISRVDLASLCPLSVSTISNLVDDLLQKKWVEESPSTASAGRGRRSMMLNVNAKLGCVATVELLGRGYICTIYNICLEKIAGMRIRNEDYDADTIATTIRNLVRAAKLPISALIGIHLIFPGVVDAISGSLLSSPVFSADEMLDRHLVIQLKRHFHQDAHVMISTNGTIIAFQEFLMRNRTTRLPLLSVNIDEAIFAGVILSSSNDQMNFCFPVEMGHIVIDYCGNMCRCGNRGCAETLLITPILFQALNERTSLNLEYSTRFGADCNAASMKKVALALEAEDADVLAVLDEYVHILCSALSSMVNLLSIRSIRIGGDIALLGEKFLQLVRKCFSAEFHLLNNTDPVQIDLFISDYENVRQAATVMCLDAIFKK